MVFWGSSLFFKFNPNRIYQPGPSKFWRRRRILRMSAHHFGRRRNCYRLALRSVQKALVYSTKARKLRCNDLLKLNGQRLASASEELGTNIRVLRMGLHHANVCLDNHMLADLSIWEPRTFQALSNFAWNNYTSQGLGDIHDLGSPPEGVILRGYKRQ
ncbi:39S ribosomal protein L20, mitochondrial [Thrips palmi]|uniref:39S ribosomal protein L20, mitochondrial n=1 Tax=Thrips palmi TaxID=161013 RepID=A0A6P9ACS5_THRPL|nr:39S ribosomal protein L20, mitochondrial [Thrips palmi]